MTIIGANERALALQLSGTSESKPVLATQTNTPRGGWTPVGEGCAPERGSKGSK